MITNLLADALQKKEYAGGVNKTKLKQIVFVFLLSVKSS
jgi:hypothetical protein